MTVVKICGIIDPEDVKMAAELGADLIGLLLWPGSKRFIAESLAIEITQAAREHHVTSVGVFVDEDAMQIQAQAELLRLNKVQLHGKKAREAIIELDADIAKLFVLEVAPDGKLETYDSKKIEQLDDDKDWLLYDSIKGGTGKTFDWKAFKPLERHNWFLSGGLNPENIQEALRLLSPLGVDVATGVNTENSQRKDYDRMARFIEKVRKHDTES